MIAPLVEEELWVEILHHAPRWYAPSKPTVVIAPHPDDETLGAGGLIAQQRSRGLPVSVICVTDGEAAYPDTPGLAGVRKLEQLLALETLGVPKWATHRLHLPDSDVSAHHLTLVKSLSALIQPGSLVLAPWAHDWHPDHEACGRAAEQVSRVLDRVSFLPFLDLASSHDQLSCRHESAALRA